MNFEDLESLWSRQPAAGTLSIDADHQAIAALKRVAIPEIRRRGRMLGYALFVVCFSLVVGPLLAVVNYRYAVPSHPTWHWLNLGIWTVVLSVWGLHLVRALRRQRALLRQSANTLRGIATASLSSLEAEARDYRRMAWQLPPLLVIQLFTLYLNFPPTEVGWAPFGLRACCVVGLPLAIAIVGWRHCRVNIEPQIVRQQEILRDLQ